MATFPTLSRKLSGPTLALARTDGWSDRGPECVPSSKSDPEEASDWFARDPEREHL